MKSLMLLNPRKRKSGAKRKKSGATARRRKSTRRKSTRRMSGSAAWTSASRRRTSGRRRKATRRSQRFVVRSAKRKRKRYATIKSKFASATIRTNPRRRRSGSSGGGISSFKSMIKDVLSRDTIAIGGGALAASLFTTGVTTRYASKLPGLSSTNQNVRKASLLAYDIAIPVIGALALRKFAPRVARGMLYGAAFKTLNDALEMFAGDAYAKVATGSYLPAVGGTGEYLNAVRPMQALPPGPAASNMLQNVQPVNGLFDTHDPYRSRGI